MGVPTFVMMCGLVGSGKTVKAHELAEQYDATVFSSDSLREELFGNINEQSRNQELFTELHKRIKDCLREGKSAIYDATNISYKKRMSFLAELKNIPCDKICVLMATPYEECLKRNAERERKVPEYVIEKMYRSFDPPFYYEGFDKIIIDYSDSLPTKKPYEWVESVENFSQDNPHHDYTLGNHCKEAMKIADEIYDNDYSTHAISTRYAALVHDCGKEFTKTFKNFNGKDSETAHYYGHEHISSYESLFFDYGLFCDILYISVLLRWHMQPFFNDKSPNKEKLDAKYRKLWGEELYTDLMNLHTADKEAH